MIKNQNFIVFSDDWGRHPSSCQHIFKRIARANKVLWVNTIGLRRPHPTLIDLKRSFEKFTAWIYRSTWRKENVIVYSPVMSPFSNVRFFRKLNKAILVSGIKRVLNKYNMINPILVTTVPNISDLLGYLGEKGIVYYCVDDFVEWPGTLKETMRKMESSLLEDADCIIATSTKLCEQKRGRKCQPYLLTHGVDIEMFKPGFYERDYIPKKYDGIKRPIIGYYGYFDQRIDLEILEYLLEKKPEWSLVIIGKVAVSTARLKKYKNIHFLKAVKYVDLPKYARAFDVSIIPYKISECLERINPLKLKEYIALGKPIVSVEIPGIISFKDVVHFAKDKFDFVEKVEEALKKSPLNEFEIKKRFELLQGEDWDSKAKEFCEYIAVALETETGTQR